MPICDVHKKKKKKNFLILIIISTMMILFFVATTIKVTEGNKVRLEQMNKDKLSKSRNDE